MALKPSVKLARRNYSGHADLRAARVRIIVSLLIVTPAGFAMKFYSGPGSAWFNNSVGGAMYVVFWCLLAAFIWPRRRAVAPIVATVFAVTCALEVMQLWNPPMLKAARSHFIGRTILGTTFVWSDFIYYCLGAAIAWLGLRLIAARDRQVVR